MDASHGATRTLPYEGGAHGVSALDTPKLEDCCLFVFGKGFEVDTQRLVGDTSSTQHDECAFAFVSLLVSLGTSPPGYLIKPMVTTWLKP